MRKFVWPLLIGVVGCAILIGLGVWQVQRLAWKEDVLAEIDARIGADPVALPEVPKPETDRFLPVRAAGRMLPQGLRVLTSLKGRGPGYRVIGVFETDGGRRVMVDQGFVGVDDERGLGSGELTLTVIGNLHWPDEVDGFTPDPDLAEGLWFARDVEPMAEALGTEPVLIVARGYEPPLSQTGLVATPLPVTRAGIPNNHLQYAITWFALASVWAGMTALWLWRIRTRND